MNYLSGAFRYVAGSDADEGGHEVRRLIERIKSASLPADRRGAVKALSDAATRGTARRAEIAELGLKAFYAVLEQDRAYEHNVRAVLSLLNVICSAETEEPHSRQAAATNIDAFLGLPNALSLVLDQLSARDVTVRTTALELLTAMAAYSLQTLQAALLDASAGVSKVCDSLDDAQPAVRASAVILLTMICTESAEVAKIVAFSGVPDKLFDMVSTLNPKTGAVLASPDAHEDVDALLVASAAVADVLQFFAALISCSPTTRTSLREVSFVPRSVELLKTLMRDSGVIEPNSPIDLASAPPHLALFKQNADNIALCLANIATLVQGTPDEVRAMTAELANTDIFAKCQSLAFLPYVDVPPPAPEPPVNVDLAVIRKAALVLIVVLVRSGQQFRKLYYQSLCASQMADAATPQICSVQTMLKDRSAALRIASYVSLRESFVLDPTVPTPSFALLNAFTGSSSLTSLVQASGRDFDEENEPELDIPAKYLAILGEALKDALTLYPVGSDEAAVFHAAALLAWTLNRVQGARERLLAAFAHNAGNSLFPQIMRVLGNAQRMNSPPIVRIGLLSLVASWLYGSSSAVSAFLSSAMHLPMICEILQKGVENDEAADIHVRGLAAVVLGICLNATDGEDDNSGESGFIKGGRGPSMVVPRGTISDVIRNHIGITVFTGHLEDLKATAQFLNPLNEEQTWKIAHDVQKVENNGVFYGGSSIGHEQYYDTDVVVLVGNVVAQVATKAMDLLPTGTPNGGISGANPHQDPRSPRQQQNPNQEPARTMEMLIADSAKDEQLNSYKEFIKAQEGNIERLQSELKQAQGKISVLESTNGDLNVHAGETLNGTSMGQKTNDTSFKQTNTRPDYSMNGASPAMHHELEDLTHRTRELTAVVANLEGELDQSRTRSSVMQTELERLKRSEEEWRRKVLEAQDVVEKVQAEKDNAVSKVTQLNNSLLTLQNDTSAKADEIGASSRRVSELEDRCAELKEMRKRAESEVVTLKKEVEVLAEQNIEVSGKLYEAEEKSNTLQNAREAVAKKLAETESALKVMQTTSQRGAANVHEISEMKVKLTVAEGKIKENEEERRSLILKLEEGQRHLSELNEMRSELLEEQRKNAAAEEERKSLCTQLEQSQSKAQEANRLNQTLSEMERRATIAEESRESLLRQLANAEGRARVAEELKGKLALAEEKLVVAEESRENMSRTLANTEAELRLSKTTLQPGTVKVEDLDAAKVKLREAEEKCVMLEDQRVKLTVKLAETENALNIARTTPQPGWVSVQELDDARNQLSMTEEKANALEESREKLAAKLAETEAALRAAKIAVSESVRIEELDVVKNKLAFAEDWNRKMEEQFRKQLENEKEKAVVARNELNGELQYERHKIRDLEEALKDKIDQLGEVSAQLVCNAAALESTEQAKRETSEKMEDMEVELEKFKGMQQELDQTRQDLAQAQETLATQLANRQNERTSRSLENRIATVESERAVLRQKLLKQKEAFESKLADLQHDVRNALETVEATKNMYRESEKAAQQAASKAAAEMGAKDSELRSTKSELERKAKILQELEEAKAAAETAFEDDIARAHLKLEEALKNLDMIAIEKDKVDGRVVELSREVTDLRKERDASVAQVETLERKVVECEAAAEDLELKVAALIEEKEGTDSKLIENSAALKDVREELAVVKKELDEETQRLNELRVKYEEHKALEAEHNELLVCLAELEMECNGLKNELGRA